MVMIRKIVYNGGIMAAKKTQKSTKRSSQTSKSITRSSSSGRKVSRRPELVVKAIVDPKTRAKLARKRMKRAPMSWREWTLLGVIVTCVVAILCSFAVKASFHPEEDAEKSLERLTSAYYTEYLYPRIMGDKTDARAVMEQYVDTGFPLVYLRQFLTFNDQKYAGEKKYFSNEHYECDENTSRVHFVPVEPYGEKDYTYTATMSCERIEE